MEQLSIDISGRGGLTNKFHGDINSTSSTPHKRYTGTKDQMADGIFNPITNYGYISPANNTYASLTGSINSRIIATEYDSVNDIAYFAENGNTIWKLDGLDDTSLSSVVTVNQSGTEILRDLEIYELNGERALFYTYNVTDGSYQFSRIGVLGLDNESGTYITTNLNNDNTIDLDSIDASGTYQKLAQYYSPTDEISFDKVIIPLRRGVSDDGGYTAKISIQTPQKNSSHAIDLEQASSQYLSILNANQTGLDITGDITIEFFVNLESLTESGKVVCRRTSAPLNGYSVNITSSGQLEFEYYDNANETVAVVAGLFTSDDFGKWVHIAISVDVSAKTFVFYRNGIVQSHTLSSSEATAIGSNTSTLTIGTDNIGLNTFLDGKLDEIRIWNDIRTEAEIVANMVGGVSGAASNLVAYWKLDNDLLDETSNSNDLTNNNSATFSTDTDQKFLGEPDGTADASGTISAANLALTITDQKEKQTYAIFTLDSTVTLSTPFWIVLEATTFGDLTGSDTMAWMGDVENTDSIGVAKRYNGTDWLLFDETVNNETSYVLFDFHYALVNSNDQNWSTDTAVNPYQFKYDSDLFMRKADNGFMYVFEDNYVHKIDGTTGGGGTGTITSKVITFPKYFKTADAVDARGRMYIGVQSDSISGNTDYRVYSESVVGIYVWDRQSTVVGTRDFIPLYGVRDIRKIFVHEKNGEVMALCIGDDRFVQLRSITRNGTLVATLGISAYPETRDSLKAINGNTVWLGADGITYMYGRVSPEDDDDIYKIGDISGQVTGAFTTGAIFVGNEDSSQSRNSILISYTDTVADAVKRWYPHGVGTISSNAQKAHTGNIYTLVQLLPFLSTVHSINVFCLPGTNTGSTTVGTIKIYFNQSQTPSITKTITQSDTARGYIPIQIGKSYINSIQLEFEYDTSLTLGTDDFIPYQAVVDFERETGVKAPTGN